MELAPDLYEVNESKEMDIDMDRMYRLFVHVFWCPRFRLLVHTNKLVGKSYWLEVFAKPLEH